MDGWSEEEIRDRRLMAPCGLYCGACGVYIATRDGNDKFRAVMANLYGTKAEETQCLGCMQPEPAEKLYSWCAMCAIRSCVRGKGFYSCHQCDRWPCSLIDGFSLATGLKVMKRAIPLWRDKVHQHGNEEGSVEWARAELERYHCPDCGNPLFRGAKRCRMCKEDVADKLDGTL